MNITQLINAVIAQKDTLSYINLDEKNRYLGWTHDFNLDLPDGKRMKLNLKNERDLFLLFILASSWSKTGQWENAAYFVTYLKMSGKDIKEFWLDDKNIRSEVENRKISANSTVESCKWFGALPRRKVSFRIDYYSSIKVLAQNWENIIESLYKSETKSDYTIFIDYIRKLDGLGTGKNRMKIKILLILRELRCQNVYKNIPGEYCCVSDERVRNASKKIGINLPAISQFTSILKASEIIYKNFGDLYDIPLFAYDDLKGEKTPNYKISENEKQLMELSDDQKEFLNYAVVEPIKYDEIEKKIGIPRKTFSPWWDELKEERNYLTMIRDIKNQKCSNTDFYEFKNWYERTDKKCFYCKITQEEIDQLWKKYPHLTKRKRGKKLEIERKKPNTPYSELENLVFSCYWCNNAKTDTFKEEEFKKIGKVIKKIWKARLNDN